MTGLTVGGGRILRGSLRVQGAKNSVLPILAATALTRERCVIRNCPNLSDVRHTMEIIRGLGGSVDYSPDSGTMTVDPGAISKFAIPESLMRVMRSSFIFLGGILARAGEVLISFPGGDDLGQRPVNMHLDAMRKMGAEISEEHGNIHCRAKRLRGAEIHLPFPSVGATENILIAAATADGVTAIQGAACEPEICDLCDMLTKMGARIKGAGTSAITVDGVDRLGGAEHRIIGDRIAAVTYLAAAAITGGELEITDTDPAHIGAAVNVLRDMGCDIRLTGNGLYLSAPPRLTAPRSVHTMPHPGFPTDAQSPVMSLCAAARGTTVFVESIFENRYQHAAELLRMGADIQVQGRVAVVTGVEKLYGAPVESTDLRGGACLVIAALAAEGKTCVGRIYHIDRGYDNFEGNLRSIGADIERGEIF